MQNTLQLDEGDQGPVLNEARLLSIGSGHGFIDYTHIFVAILLTPCKASRFCRHCDPEEWQARLGKMYPSKGQVPEDQSIPLTRTAERMIRHAQAIAGKMDEEMQSTVHLLLAMLTISSAISKAFERAGISFEDVVAAYGGKPFPKFPPKLPPVWQKPYPAWRVALMNKAFREKKVQQWHSKAVNYWMENMFAQCVAASKVGLSLDEGNRQLRMLLLGAMLETRDFRQALDYLQPWLAAEPQSIAYLSTLEYIYNGLGEYQQAIKLLEELLVIAPGNKGLLNNMGFNLSLLKKYKEAIPYLEKAICADPGFSYAYDNLGFAKCKLGQTEEGLALIERSLELDKGNAHAYKDKGVVLYELNEFTEAARNFRMALKFDFTRKYGDEVNDYLARMEAV